MLILSSVITHFILAAALILAAAVAGLMAYHFAKAKLREREGFTYDPEEDSVSPSAGAEARAKSAEEIAQIRARIESLMEQQTVRTETQGQHLAQKMDEIRSHMGQQDAKMDGIKSELRHEIRQRNTELDELRGQLASALDAFWQNMPALQPGESGDTLALPPASSTEEPEIVESFDERLVEPTPYEAAEAPPAQYEEPAYEEPTFEEPAIAEASIEPIEVAPEPTFALEAPPAPQFEAPAREAEIAPTPPVFEQVAAEPIQPTDFEPAADIPEPPSLATIDIQPQPEAHAIELGVPTELQTQSEIPAPALEEATFEPVAMPNAEGTPEVEAPVPAVDEPAPAAPEIPAFEPIDATPYTPPAPEPTALQHIEMPEEASFAPIEPVAQPAEPVADAEVKPVAPLPATDLHALPSTSMEIPAEPEPQEATFTPVADLSAAPPQAPVVTPSEPAPAQGSILDAAAIPTGTPNFAPPAEPVATPTLPPAEAATFAPVNLTETPLPEAIPGSPTQPEAPPELVAQVAPPVPTLPQELAPHPVELAPEPASSHREDRPPVAPESGSANPPTSGDDLTRINGIDAEIQQKLYAINVTKLDEMARWSRADARRISAEVGVPEETIRTNWIFEAQSLLFDSYQDQLTKQQSARGNQG